MNETPASTCPPPDHQPASAESQASLVLSHLNGWAAAELLSLGDRMGLLDGLLAGVGSAVEIASRSSVNAACAREWLRAMVAAGHVRESRGRYSAVAGFAEACRSAGGTDLLAWIGLPQAAARVQDDLVAGISSGRGVPHDVLHQPFRHIAERLSAPLYEEFLIRDWLASVPGLVDCLHHGAHLIDVGCGGGQAARLLAREFPAATITGVDSSEEAITDAIQRSADSPNVRFRHALVPPLPRLAAPVNVVLMVNILHDLPRPAATARNISQDIEPGGYLVIVEMDAAGDASTDATRPYAVLSYYSSLTHCVQVSLAAGGDGPGSLSGPDLAEAALAAPGLYQHGAHHSASGRLVRWARRRPTDGR